MIPLSGPSVTVEGLTLGYDGPSVVLGLSGHFKAGGMTAITGPNGAGKSTLLKALAGLLKPRAGTIRFTPNTARRAYLPQRAMIDRDFPITVFELVAAGLWCETGALGALDRKHRGRVDQALERTGLGGFGSRRIGALSGGQMQRALFARLLLQDAAIILADEPFAAVDAATIEDLLALFDDMTTKGATVVTILHDLDLVKARFPDTLLIAREAIAWGKTEDVLTAEHLATARARIDARDAFGRRTQGMRA